MRQETEHSLAACEAHGRHLVDGRLGAGTGREAEGGNGQVRMIRLCVARWHREGNNRVLCACDTVRLNNVVLTMRDVVYLWTVVWGHVYVSCEERRGVGRCAEHVQVL